MKRSCHLYSTLSVFACTFCFLWNNKPSSPPVCLNTFTLHQDKFISNDECFEACVRNVQSAARGTGADTRSHFPLINDQLWLCATAASSRHAHPEITRQDSSSAATSVRLGPPKLISSTHCLLQPHRKHLVRGVCSLQHNFLFVSVRRSASLVQVRMTLTSCDSTVPWPRLTRGRPFPFAASRPYSRFCSQNWIET